MLWYYSFGKSVITILLLARQFSVPPFLTELYHNYVNPTQRDHSRHDSSHLHTRAYVYTRVNKLPMHVRAWEVQLSPKGSSKIRTIHAYRLTSLLWQPDLDNYQNVSSTYVNKCWSNDLTINILLLYWTIYSTGI